MLLSALYIDTRSMSPQRYMFATTTVSSHTNLVNVLVDDFIKLRRTLVIICCYCSSLHATLVPMWLAGILFSLTMLMVSVALVMAVVVTNIFLRKDSGKRVPSSVRRVFLHRRHRPRSLSSQRDSMTSAAAPAIIGPTTVVGSARNHDSAAVKYRDTLDLDSLSILSELEQQNSATGVVVRQNSRRGCSSSTRRCSPSVITNTRRSRATSMQHTDPLTTDTANELYSREWQMLAKVVDRIFFWLFVFSSIGALGSMFASLPHKNLS